MTNCHLNSTQVNRRNPAMYTLWEFLKTRWWGQLICALLFWAIAAFEYWDIFRQRHVSLFRWPDLILYSMLGKWG